MWRGRRVQAQAEPAAETQAASRAERVAKWLQVPMIVAALLAIPTIIVQESDLGGVLGDHRRGRGLVHLGDVRGQPGHHALSGPGPAALVDKNPMDVLIVVLTPPFLPATMKLARVLPVVRLVWLMAIAHRLRNVFSLQGLRYAALIVFTVVVGGGVVFVAVERGQDLSTWDGLWWAAETVTTVAYGDIYPTTAMGRLVATVVMTAGIGFVALLTGALAQRFLYGGSASATPETRCGQSRDNAEARRAVPRSQSSRRI